MKRSSHGLRRWVLVLLCIILCTTTAVPVTAASKKGSVTSVKVTNVSKGKLSLAKGKTFTLKTKVAGKGSFSKKVTYKSSNKKVVSVTAKGKLKALKKGTAKITVTSSANKKKKAVVKVTVTVPVTEVKLNKTKATLDKGQTLQLKATVSPSGASNKKVTWKSSDASVAAVSSGGKVTAKKAGSATITVTAKDGSKKKASCTITVKEPVTTVAVTGAALSKTTALLEIGDELALTATVSPANATNKKVTYTSSAAGVASVDANGKVKAIANGTAVITATTADGGKTAKCTVTVKTAVKTLALQVPSTMETGKTAKATATYTPAKADGVTLSYAGDNAAVASVQADGTIRALTNGEVKVTVTAMDSRGTKLTKSAKITVYTSVASVSLDETTIILNKNEEKQLTAAVLPGTASNQKVSFTSSAPGVASVDAKGLVKGISTGKADITVTTEDGRKTAVCSIEVRTPVSSISLDVPDRIEAGTQVQAKAEYAPQDADRVTVLFQGDSRNVAEVSREGMITALANGTCKVMVTATDMYGNVAYDEKDVVVWTPVSEVKLDSDSISLYEGGEQQLITTVLPDEASQKKVLFTSSDTSVATVSDSGLVKAVAEGSADVTAMSEDGTHYAVCHVEVKKILTAMTVSTRSELEEAFNNENLQQLTIASAEEVRLTIPEGNHDDISLIVDAPQGHIENHGTFKSIVINEIGSSSFVEYAVGNRIIYKAPAGRLVTEQGAVVTSLSVEEGASALDLVNNGNITNVLISVTAQVSISGENENRISVTAAQTAANTQITTSITLKVQAEAVITLLLQPGSENSMVSVDKQENAPVVNGIGEVSVTTRDNGVTETILAENTDQTVTKTVRISGVVKDVSGNLVPGAALSFIPYRSGITESSLAACTGDALAAAVTDEDGSYLTDPIPIGNYYVYVTAEGFAPVSRKVSVDSTYEDVYPFAEIAMLAEGETETGSITGVLTDARTNAAVAEGITVRLREGADNKSGSYIAETLTGGDGSYSFADLPAGQYTVQVIDLRNDESGYYLTDYMTIAVGGGSAEGGFPIRFSQTDAGNQITFTLTWGNEASGASSDLDSHLVGPAVDGGQFHTWYEDLEYYYSGDDEASSGRYDFLDYDDTTWEGPENTTIEKSVDGIYHFYIHDFSNRDNPGSSQMSISSAVVTVHSSEGTIGTYRMPNETGNLWHVCDYDSGTGKITAVNRVYQYDGSASDIGIDLAEKYRGLLQEYLEKAELLRGIADAGTLTMLDEAKKTLETSDDSNALMQAYMNVRDFVDGVLVGLRIDDIRGDTVAGYSYDQEDIASGDVALTIRGYDPVMNTEGISVSLYDENSTWSWETDENPDAPMIVVKNTDGISCRYHITYEADQTDCSIAGVSAVRDGEDLIDDWWTDYDYIGDGDEEREIDTLVLYGYDAAIPAELAVAARNPYAQAGAVEASDLDGFDGKVTVSAGGNARTWYIRWHVSSSLLQVGSVSAIDADGNEWVTDWYTDSTWIYDEETEDEYSLYYIEVESFGADVLQYLKAEPRYSGVQAGEITASDREGYDGMVTFTAGDLTRTWYIRLSLSDYVFDISEIEAYDDNDEYVSVRWSTEKTDEVSWLNIQGAAETMPARLTFYPSYSDASCGELEASDIEGYDGRFTVTYKGLTKVWYVRYQQGEECCEIAEIRAEDAEGNALVDFMSTGTNWIWNEETGEEYRIEYAEIYGRAIAMPEKLTIIPRYEGVTAGEVTDSDRDGYEKMVTLSRGSISRTYYLKWSVSDDFLEIGGVTAQDDAGNDLVTNWYTDSEWIYDDETDEERIVYFTNVYSYSADVLHYLKAEPRYSSVQAGEITASDREGYDGMVTFTAGDLTRTWYIRLNISEEVFNIGWLDGYDADGNSVNVEVSIENEYDADGNFVRTYLDMKGNTEGIPARLAVDPYYSETVCGDLEASDLEAYDAMFTMTYQGAAKTWYIRYAQRSEYVCAVGSIRPEGDVVENWNSWTNWVWNDELEDSEKVNVLEINAYTAEIPENLEIVPVYEDVDVSPIVASDREGYAGMVTLSRGDLSETWYILWNLSESVLSIASVEADGNELPADLNAGASIWNEELQDDEYVLYSEIYDVPAADIEKLAVIPRRSDVAVSGIRPSDREGYDGMVTLSLGDFSRTHYLIIHVMEEAEETGEEVPEDVSEVSAGAEAVSAETAQQEGTEAPETGEMTEEISAQETASASETGADAETAEEADAEPADTDTIAEDIIEE